MLFVADVNGRLAVLLCCYLLQQYLFIKSESIYTDTRLLELEDLFV